MKWQEHSCPNTAIYAMEEVTVWVRLFKDGRVGGIRDSKQSITHDAIEQVGNGSDLVCAGCGWIGRYEEENQ